MHKQANITPAWLTDRFSLKFLASGSFGVVFEAHSLTTGRRFALKMSVVADGDGLSIEERQANMARETIVSMLLSTLYVDSGDPFKTLTPVVIAYDYGVAIWLRNGVRAFLKPFRTAENAKKLTELEERTRITNPIGFLLMDLVAGTTLAKLLADATPADYFRLLPELLLQVLLILCDLQRALRFVHYDLHGGNVMVETLDAPVVLHYRLNNSVTYNIRTRYVVRLIDFGYVRLEWEGSTHFTPDGGYVVAATGSRRLDKFRPWADRMTLGASLLTTMTDDQFADLKNRPAVRGLLHALVALPGDIAEVRTLRSLLARIGGGDDGRRAPDRGEIGAALNAMHGRVYDPPAGGDAGVQSLEDIITSTDNLFGRHSSYEPTKSDVIYDMTMQVGDKSAATRVSAKALQAVDSKSYGWMTSWFG